MAFKCIDFKVTPPPMNMTHAELHFGYNDSLGTLRAVVVVVPGANGDGRKVLLDHKWISFVKKNRFLLVGISFSSAKHDLQNGRGYYHAELGSGKVLSDGLKSVGCEHLPMAICGFSGGAHFVSSFIQYRPKDVKAWCAYSAAWWDVINVNSMSPPGIVACGANDFRKFASLEYFQSARENDAKWLWVEIPHMGHESSPELEDFFRLYALVAFDKKSPSPMWINVLSGRMESDLFKKKYPCAMGWLPDRALYAEWLNLRNNQKEQGAH